MAKKDISFVLFTDLITIQAVQYRTFVMRDGSRFDYTSLDTLDTIKNYGYNLDTDLSYYVLRLQVSPSNTYIETVTYGEEHELSFSKIGKDLLEVTLLVTQEKIAFPILSGASFEITSSALTTNKQVDMQFLVSENKISSTTGLLKLSQQVIKILLSNIRTNRYSISEGTSLLSLLGQNVSPIELVEGLTEAIESTKNFILKKQSITSADFFNVGSDADERLVSMYLVNIETLETDPSQIKATIRMVTAAGNNLNIPILV